jgi:hypothetical protein
LLMLVRLTCLQVYMSERAPHVVHGVIPTMMIIARYTCLRILLAAMYSEATACIRQLMCKCSDDESAQLRSGRHPTPTWCIFALPCMSISFI